MAWAAISRSIDPIGWPFFSSVVLSLPYAAVAGRSKEATRRTAIDGRLLVIAAIDPLNLAGIVTTGDRVRSAASSRVAYRDGIPIAVL